MEHLLSPSAPSSGWSIVVLSFRVNLLNSIGHKLQMPSSGQGGRRLCGAGQWGVLDHGEKGRQICRGIRGRISQL